MNLFSQTDNTQRILTHKGRNFNYNQYKCQENFQDSAETAIFAPRKLKIAFTGQAKPHWTTALRLYNTKNLC